MAIGFELLLQNLDAAGVFDLFLPWLLILAVSYGILKKTEALGDEDSVIAIASVAISFLGVAGIFSVVPAEFFAQFFALISVLLVVVLGIVIVLGLFGVDISDLGESNWFRVGTVLTVIGIVVVLAFSLLPISLSQSSLLDSDMVSTVIMLIVVGAAIYFVTQGNGNGE